MNECMQYSTIHQPSYAIFSAFDSLLLLKRGGKTVFFGPIGDKSSNLIGYLQSIPGTPSITPGENPATWMLSKWYDDDSAFLLLTAHSTVMRWRWWAHFGLSIEYFPLYQLCS